MEQNNINKFQADPVDVTIPKAPIIQPIENESQTSQITSKNNALGNFYNKNRNLIWAFIVCVIAFTILIFLLILNSNRSINNNPTPIVSSPISRPSPTPTPENQPPSSTGKTINFSIDNSFTSNQKPYSTLKGSVFTTSDVTFSKPDRYTGIFKKGASSLTLYSFPEEYQHKLLDAVHIGTTKTLGDTYRISEVGEVEGQIKYFYVNKSALVLSGTCNPASFPNPIAAPCGVTNYQTYYLQCTGNTNFTFCDSIIKDLEFTITFN